MSSKESQGDANVRDQADPQRDEQRSIGESVDSLPAVEKPQAPTFPEGGARAWSVALGATGVLFCTFGYNNAYGILQDYYQTHQLHDKKPSDIAWIGSMQVFFLLSGGLISGPLFDRFGAVFLMPAALSYVFSIMMTSLCKEYYQFILAQGLLGGLSIGMLLSPSLAVTGHYFQKNRAKAMGVVVAGSSLGGVLIPIMLTKMFPNPNLHFGWTMRIVGFFMLAILAPSCYAIRPRLPPRRGRFLLPRAFTELPYVAMVAGIFMLLLGVFVPMFYLPSYAISHGMSPTLAPYLIAIFNAASLFGRILPGIVANKFGRFNILFGAAFISGIIAFCWQAATSNAGIIAFSAFYGFFSGTIISMMSVCVSMLPQDPNEIGTYLGMGISVASIGGLIGTPISGALLTNDGYGSVADFAGAVSIAGALLILLSKWATGKGVLSIY